MTKDALQSDLASYDSDPSNRSLLLSRSDKSTGETLDEDSLESEHRRQLVDRLLAESRVAEYMHVVLILVVAVLFWNDASRTGLFAWIAAVAGASLARALVRRHLASKPTDTAYALTNIRRVVLLSALAWAIGPGVLAGSLHIDDLALLMVVFAGLVAAATSSLLADARSFHYFATGILGPFFVAILVSGQTRAHVVAALLILLFAGTMVITFRRSHAQLVLYVKASRQLTISENEARRGRGFLEAMLANAPSAIATLDAGGRVLGVNPAFEHVFGYSAEEATGSIIDELIVPESELESARDLERQVRTGRVVVADVPRRTKAGDTVWVQASAAQVSEEAGHGAWFVMYEDITARKHLAEEREQARLAAEQAARTKSAFLANMSHEIRTPMNGVLGMLELLRETDLDEPQRQSVELAASSAESLLAILNDILDVSKIEAGQLELESIPFDVQKMVTNAAKVMTVPSANRGNELHIDIGPDIPELVLGDPGRMRQVITNLLSNAIKFTKDGEVMVSLSVVERKNGKVLVRSSVKDTGIGIPEDRLGSIFKEFTQADASVTRTHGGTGLGLTISQRIVDQMGGKLEVTSEEGVGSEFWFIIPFEDMSDSLAANRKPTKWVGLDGQRLLVVDDNEIARRIVREAFEQHDFKVDEADCVDRALELLHEAVREDALYDAAIIDRAMPDRDGFELAAEVEADPQLSGMRLMMLSSAAEAEGRKKAREHYIKAYLTKPVTRADLIDAMQALLGLRGPGEGHELRMVTENSLAHERPRASVLLAEDNKTNQLIALALLTKRGHDVDVAENGAEALEKVKSKRYDVVLMDIQMPEMDGLEATRAIRKLVQHEKMPIVALTAHALAEEREQCEAAGMNHFVTKPFKPFELHDAVERWVRPSEDSGSSNELSERPESEEAPKAVPVDLGAFRSAMADAGVEEVVPTTITTYLDEAPGRFKAISDAVHAGDAQAIGRAAHALKSASSAIHADSLAELLQQLEATGGKGTTQQAQGLYLAVQKEYERVLDYLKRDSA